MAACRLRRMPQPFEIVFLGTGSPLNSPDRCGCGHVIVAGGHNVVVDLGYGAARRLMPSGVLPANVDIAVFTHMHSDHITDVPDFLNMRWTGGASTPLRVFGPVGTKRMIEGFLMALEDDIRFRNAHHPGKLHPDGIRVEVTEIPAGTGIEPFLSDDGLALERFEVDHFPVVPAFGYRVKFDGRTAVLSGDTSYCESLATAAEGADLLVSDALQPQMFAQFIERARGAGMTTAASLLEDVPSYHMSTTEAARLAKDAGVGRLILSHLIPNLPNNKEMEDAFMAGMAAIFGGPISLARDTQRITVERQN